MKLLHCSAIIVLAALNAYALFENSTDLFGPGDYIITMPANARQISMGNTGVSMTGKANLLATNPASLSGLWWQEASAGVTPLFDGAQCFMMSYAIPVTNRFVIGSSLHSLSSGEVERTNAFGEYGGTFQSQDMALLLASSYKPSENFGIGMSFKGLSSNIDSRTRSAVSSDFGLVYDYTEDQRWGLALVNLIPATMGSDEMNFHVRTGFTRTLAQKRMLISCDLLMSGLFQSADSKTHLMAGVEYNFYKYFAVRGGINEKQASIGFGIISTQLDMDYAFIYHPLSALHSLTLNIRYGFEPTAAEKHLRESALQFKNEITQFEEYKNAELSRIKFEKSKLIQQDKLSMQFIKAKKLFEENKFTDAKNILDGILAVDPQSPAALELYKEVSEILDGKIINEKLAQAGLFYKQGDYAKCLEKTKEILAISRHFQEAEYLSFLAQAQIFIQDKRFNDAKGELFEAIKVKPESDEVTTLLKRLQNVIEMQELK